MNSKHSSPPPGFTLLEVLLAMTLLGLVVTAIYSTWTGILRAAKVGQDAAAAAQRSRIAMRVIENALTSARLFAANAPHYAFVAENGSDAVLSFVARLPKSFPRSGKFGDLDVRRVTFSVERGPDSDSRLVLRQTPLLMEMDEDEQGYPLVLARYVKELRLEFWDTRAGDGIEEWTQTNQLPRLVKVSLVFGQSGSYSTRPQPEEEVVRIVALPTAGVPPNWQVPSLPPGMPAGPGATNILRGQPGVQPPTPPPIQLPR